MQTETFISHCALNQLSHLLIQKNRDMKWQIYYNTQWQHEKVQELIRSRQLIITYIETTGNLEKAIQRFLLMPDDIGIQSILYLILLLSDFEIKGLPMYIDKSSSQQSFQTPDKESLVQFIMKPINRNKPKQQSMQKSLWWKKQANILIDFIDHVLSDSSFTKYSVKLSLLLMGNLYALSKDQAKTYMKKKAYPKLQRFFEDERKLMSEEEIKELDSVLRKFYSMKEIFGLTKKPMKTPTNASGIPTAIILGGSGYGYRIRTDS